MPNQRWAELESIKQPFMNRAEKYANWTLPYVFPYAGYTGQIELDNDWDSVGAQAVNHLANKIMLALFAPARPFFRMDADDAAMIELTNKYKVDEVQIKLMFSRAETEAMRRLVKKSGRTALGQLTKQLIITGNGMLHIPEGRKAQAISLRDYCVSRDLYGNVTEILIKEAIAFGKLPQDAQDNMAALGNGRLPTDAVDLFTWVRLQLDGQYLVTQYADDQELTNVDTRGVYRKENLPWIPVTWNLTRGCDYGTGHVEDYSGEFHTIDILNQSMVEGAAVAAELKFLVDPNGVADVEELNNAEQGDYVWGKETDVSAMSVDKQADWNMLGAIIAKAESRIGRGFLMNSSVTRDAERVTAEEIRIQAMELETALGGVYSHLAEELQTPVAWNVLAELNLDKLQGVEPMITTGMDSLSRGSEHEQFMLWMQDLSILNNIPEDVRAIMKVDGAMTKMATGRGVKFEDVVKSAEQIQADQQQAMAQQKQMMQDEAQAKQQSQLPV